jgi:hypothetical protein
VGTEHDETSRSFGLMARDRLGRHAGHRRRVDRDAVPPGALRHAVQVCGGRVLEHLHEVGVIEQVLGGGIAGEGEHQGLHHVEKLQREAEPLRELPSQRERLLGDR